MKKTFFSLALMLSGTILFAQHHNDRNDHNRQQTPQQVQDAFNREHPNSQNANWSKTNGQWHATYNDNNRNADDYYDNKGRKTYSRVTWDKKDLPNNYDRRIRTKYHTKNYRVTKIERTNNQPSLFELIFNVRGRNKTVYTDDRGNEVRYRPGH